MRLRHSAILTSTCLALWALTGCSAPPSDSALAGAQAETPVPTGGDHGVLPSERLADRLLTANDLGPGYTARPAATTGSPEASVEGCPQLEQLGRDADNPYAMFPNQGKRVFTGPGGTQLTEELYSAPPKNLSARVGRIMTAMGTCPSYQLVTATTVAEIRTQTMPVPRLGDEQWAQILTVTASGRRTIVQQTVIRDGAVLLVVSGNPAEVTVHAQTALAKATAR
ncbi:hypothetical protein [Streptomyces antibioticus]|uniref:PknH-like extracellular domain-containing protein n=1 Tax=Streptomyces antibioticus TaxID=1890 RepID=A0AAE7CJV4_STRAT|nr:hypothetical protein [Streptomyces antibioticus]OOQ55314.1 hypothetical protein AFM16_04725 [Streptomyces antibioticus]QIT42953.1 hypothetical protein HCX60_04935 [Streptomyces antibioticus]